MRVVIAGGHGKIALLLAPSLTGSGHEVAALIRNPEHADDVRATGAEPVLCDLENAGADEVADVVKGCDAAIFAAGAGQGSGADRKYTVDLGGSVRLAETAERTGVRRFLQISTMGAGRPPLPVPTRCGPRISTPRRKPKTTCGAGISTGPSCGPAG